ncbi:hypothetical protein CPB86DRAFT_781354 [Serendipita vermifera]|nr:hypothetical protein CPB86DRAFT_781354 [Serendipita vermifera]
MPNIDMDLGDAPYLVALHTDEYLTFQPARIDQMGHGILQCLTYIPPSPKTSVGASSPTTSHSSHLSSHYSPTSTSSSSSGGRFSFNSGSGGGGGGLREVGAGMNERVIEFVEKSKPVKKGALVVSTVRGFGFGREEMNKTMDARLVKADTVPYAEPIRITFAWPGLPVVQAYPMLSSHHSTRAELASLVSHLIFGYFTWALQQPEQAAIPCMPWEYNMDPHGFLRRFVRVMRLVEVGDHIGGRGGTSWTPVLGVSGLIVSPNGSWTIPRVKCEDCEKGICQNAY